MHGKLYAAKAALINKKFELGKVITRITTRIVSGIEIADDYASSSVDRRRMFAQRNIRKALLSTPNEEVFAMDMIDTEKWSDAIGDGYSPHGEWANRVMHFGNNAYHFAI